MTDGDLLMGAKKYLRTNVLQESRDRIKKTFDEERDMMPSGGKDSSVMFHLVTKRLRRGVRVGVIHRHGSACRHN